MPGDPMRNTIFAVLAGLVGAGLLFVLVDASATRDVIGGQITFQIQQDFTIANGQTVSGALDSEDYCLIGIQYATMTGTSLTAQCAQTLTGTYVALNGADNAAWSITIADDRHVDLTQGGEAICGCRFIKLVSGSSEGSARTINGVFGR